MTTNTAPAALAIETTSENGHLIRTLKVNGTPVAERFQHIVTGQHFVRDFTAGPTGELVIPATRDERAAKVAFMKLYRRHAAA